MHIKQAALINKLPATACPSWLETFIKWLKHKEKKRQNCFTTGSNKQLHCYQPTIEPETLHLSAEVPSSKLLNSRTLSTPVQGIFPTLTPPPEWLYAHV